MQVSQFTKGTAPTASNQAKQKEIMKLLFTNAICGFNPYPFLAGKIRCFGGSLWRPVYPPILSPALHLSDDFVQWLKERI